MAESMPDAAVAAEQAKASSAPEEPSLPMRQWLRQNLFSSVSNAALTVLFTLLSLWALRGLLNFVFSEERDWNGLRVNMRLLFTQAYPEEQYSRVWVSVGVVAVLAGLSVGLVSRLPGVSMRRLSTWLMASGSLIALCVVLREPSVLMGPGGRPVRDAEGDVVREAFIEAVVYRGWWWLLAAVLFGSGLAVWRILGDARRRSVLVPAVPLALAALGLLVASLWVYPWGHYGFADGELIIEPGRTVAASTKIPWTVMWLLLVLSTGVGRRLRDARSAAPLRIGLNVAWLLAPFVLYWIVLRDPDFDWAHVCSTDLPMAAAFVFLGAALLWFLTRSSAGEFDRLIAVGLLALAAFNWVAAYFGWYPMLQKARFSFLLLALAALAAPNFAGVRAQRLRLIGTWVVLMAAFHFLVTAINSPATVETPTASFLGGFSVTLVITVFTLLFSFPLGVALALARTSRLPIFRVLATAYIETVRGIPLITILFFFSIMVPLFLPPGMDLAEMAAVGMGFTLFSAAYLAENVRGGLQSVRRGQYEAADAVGLAAAQRTSFIVLPQALRVAIPPLVGQAIATFKETSLIAIVGMFDFLRIANSVIPAQSAFLGVKREGLLFVSAVYWVFAFAMSKYSQRLERRVGLGER